MTDSDDSAARARRRRQWASGVVTVDDVEAVARAFQRRQLDAEYWRKTTAAERFWAVYNMAIESADLEGLHEDSKRLCRSVGGLRAAPR